MKKTKRTQLNKQLKVVTAKMILLGLTLVLLISCLVYFTAAWYTKMVSVSGLKFEAAKWDFSANFAIDDFKINVYQYSSITQDKVAPGTGGVIPISLAAYQSETNISYMIAVKRDTMHEKFKERIFFYYLDASGNKVYFDGSPSNPKADSRTMVGEIARGEEAKVNIYWEWVYEAPVGSSAAVILEWDEFDTEVGKNPELWSNQMNAEVSIIGEETRPTREATAAQ